jgi:hypothetical protein
MASRIAGVGMVTVSLRRSMIFMMRVTSGRNAKCVIRDA